MTILRCYLVIAFATILIFTLFVGSSHGWDFAPVFIEEISNVTWSGQFNVDFVLYLLLSGLWVAWRHRFSGPGILLGLAASVGGMLFFAIYLLVMSFRANGDLQVLLLGETRSAERRA